MSNVLSEEQKQQVIALGRLGWSLLRIQKETGVRRETISAYLKEAGVALRPLRGRRIRAKPASQSGEVTPDGTESPEACTVIETAPGEEIQVDYGVGPMVRDGDTGKYRRTRLFVLTLGYSRKSIRLLVFHSSSQTWAELHEKAFRRLGGVTRVAVLDNLREGVLKPDIYDPTVNPLYRDMLRHYNVVALPCRVRDSATVRK